MWAAKRHVRRYEQACGEPVNEALANVGMSALAQPVGLSGGQLQRVLFARLLVQQAPLILLDEPFTGIDSATTQILLQVIAQLHRQNADRRAARYVDGCRTFSAGADSAGLPLGAERVLEQVPRYHAAERQPDLQAVAP